MTNRDLLAEAIADAKAVKETAIANAKASLEEAFTPHLKSMLAAKLEEMDKEDEIEEAKTEELEEMDAVSFDEKNGESMDATPKKVGQTTVQEEEIDEELNLDELLAELEKEEIDEAKEEIDESKEEIDEAKEEIDEAKEEIEESEEIEEAEAEEETEEMEDEESEEESEETEEEEIDLEDMSEDDLKSFIEGVIKDMVETGELEAGEEFEAEEDAEGEIEMGDEEIEVEDELDLDMMEGDKEEVMEEKEEVEENDISAVLAEIEALKEELKEVNLLNSKLLYTNKIFKAKNLSEAKKVKVLEAFDKAQTVKEAKLIFETLNEGITSTPQVNKIKGNASKAAGMVVENKQAIVDVDPMVARWKTLAGL